MSFGWASSILSCVQCAVVPVSGLVTAPLAASVLERERFAFAGCFCADSVFGAGETRGAGIGSGEVLGDCVPPGTVRSAGFADRMRSGDQ
jgi:hypothetical protein